MIVLLTLVACTNDFSNAIFADDAGFLDALPSGEHLYLSYPTPDDGVAEDDERAALYDITVGTLSVGGSVLELATTATEQILALPPQQRGEDYRVWGPVPYDDNPDYFLRVEMSRSSTGATYTYAFQLAETSAGLWYEFLEGQHDVGQEEVALGSGHVIYRDVASDASVQIDYDLRDGRAISAVVDQVDLGDGVVDQTWSWVEDDDGGAQLAYLQPADLVDGVHQDAGEELAVTSRWTADGAGRGEGTITGGDLGTSTWTINQCWSESGTTTWSWDSTGTLDATGIEENCTLQ